MGISRRRLLEHIASVGGVGAAYIAMETLGLAVPTPAGAEAFTLPRVTGTGPSVVILGAGLAGLVSAYELQRAGYQVTVLEARDRVGGRVWTIRGGDRIVQTGRLDQAATFDPGLYFDAGAMRIPSTHRAILGYARKFRVRLEPFVNVNRNAGWDFGGKVRPQRQMVEDMRGLLAELLAKAIDAHALDQAVSKDELAAVRQFLGPYAGVGSDGKYVPNGNSGFVREGGGYTQSPVPLPPLSFSELAPSVAIGMPYNFEHISDMQATMLQPVGGMDRIVEAIYEQVRPTVRLGAPVTAIRRVGDRVRIEHGPGALATEADYCICTLPMPILARIPSDFSAAKKAALTAVGYAKPVKLAFEAPRFWETDDDIYGGIAWTDRPNENIVYPSANFGTAKGVLMAAFVASWTHDASGGRFTKLSHAERFRLSRDSVEALHPGRSHLLSKGVTVAWALTPWSEGMSALWPDDPFAEGGGGVRGTSYFELLRPEGPVVFAGEHLSYQPAWQEGAVLSAHEALKVVARMMQQRSLNSASAGSKARLSKA